MKVYVLYVHDDRYAVPTMDSTTAIDDAAGVISAMDRLLASPHYFAVELWEGDRLVWQHEARPRRSKACDVSGAG